MKIDAAEPGLFGECIQRFAYDFPESLRSTWAVVGDVKGDFFDVSFGSIGEFR